jgi:HK97 family phage prohead protease
MKRCVPFVIGDNTAGTQEQAVAVCLHMWAAAGGKNTEAGTMATHARAQKNYLSVPFEIKSLAAREFEGYGSTFGNVDLGGDVVIPGAFAKTLKAHRGNGTLPAMFWMHQPDKVPGKWLDMSEDSSGLYVKGVLAPTPLGDEIHALLKMEAVRGLSIGYQVEDDAYDKAGNRLLKEIDLWEVSPVSLAMNPLAQVTHAKCQLSSIGEYVPTPRELEEHFRDMGCSRKAATRLVAKIFGNGSPSGTLDEPQRDADDSELARALDELRDTAIAGMIKL